MAVSRLALMAALASFVALPAVTPALADENTLAVASFRTNDQAEAGTADLAESPRGVLIRLDLEGLAPGWHGIHFHETGDCSDHKFMKAGSHVTHHDKLPPHGLLNPEGDDDGDLPNIYVAEDGTAKAELFSTFVSLSGTHEKRAHLLDEDGAAIVIHEAPDDHVSQPIGGAGARVACAVIRKAE